MKAEFIAHATGGTWQTEPSFPITLVTQDSRKACLGALYVALKGERHDGNDFVEAAFKGGATAVMVRRDWTAPEAVAHLPVLRVDDPAKALCDLAKLYRAELPHTHLLGVTGSAGKTTLKELAAAMFSGAGLVSATPGNYNNEVGLPLSLLAIAEDAHYAVIEAGISHPKDMDPLAKMMRPDAAVLSSIGPAHIEYFGSEQAIAAEKAKLLAAVPEKGYVVLSAECHELDTLRAATKARLVICSLRDKSADYYGEPLPEGRLRVFKKDEPAQLLEVALAGEHNASNLLLAYAAVREAGISATQAVAGLRTFQPPAMRWQCHTIGQIHIINDAYNANPLSMRAALETFAGTQTPGEKVVCVGDMLELGTEADAHHRHVGVRAGCGPWRLLIGIGASSRALLQGAIEAGYPESQTAWFATTSQAAEQLPLLLTAEDTLLLKASRGMRLEALESALHTLVRN